VLRSPLVPMAIREIPMAGERREGVVREMVTLQYSLVRPAVAQSDLTTIGQYM
jgi:hypothetical protein